MKTVPFDRSRLTLLPLAGRCHDMTKETIAPLAPVDPGAVPAPVLAVARRMVAAKQTGASILFMMGAHVLRSGVQRFLTDLMARGYISAIAGNGACAIHDFELALIGATTESVAEYIRDGRFGLWKETGYVNDIVNQAFATDPGQGFGEALGREILNGDYPHKDVSLLAAGARLGVHVGIHVALGQDIVHQHENFDPAAAATLSYNDFLKFAAQVENLENGVVMNFGTAVMGPEVFLKALAMARNAARSEGRTVEGFASLVADLRDLGPDYSQEPEKTRENYYFRPQKTLLVRTLSGGESFYVKGRHENTVPALWTAVNMAEAGEA
ncbi:MAG: hypothetical protein KKA60_05395 [Proteobacteria bacterium]|nr:hypothetical protein [Pseudomonadota bacterium]